MIVQTETRPPTPPGASGSGPAFRTERSSDTLAVSSGPAEACEAFDLSADVTFTAGIDEPRAVWVNGAGNVKVDGYKRDGKTPSTGIVFTMAQAGPLPAGRFTKIYSQSNGSTVTAGIVALW